MNDSIDIARKKMARWRVLRILYSGQPYPVGEGLIAEIMPDADLAMTPAEIRNVLQYLFDKALINVKEVRRPGEGVLWEARLLPNGVDFVEYNSADDTGITRPYKN